MDKKQVTDQPDNDVIEVRLTDIWLFFKRSRWSIIGYTAVFSILGGIYAAVLPNEYTSQVTVMPELSSKNIQGGIGGGLNSLAGIAGINLDGLASSSESIRPDLYPTILQTTPFTLYLLEQPVNTALENKTQSFNNFLEQQSKRSLSGKIRKIFSENSENNQGIKKTIGEILAISQDEEEKKQKLQEKITASYDKKTGILLINVLLEDPVVAAMIANHTLIYLTNYITEYRTEKARQEVQFLNQQVDSAKRKYYEAESAISQYRDKNRNLFLNTAKIEEQRLQAEFLLAQDIYNSLSKQYELAKIKVQEQTPVFKKVEPARIPFRPTKPNRGLILIISIILGSLLGLILNIIKYILHK